LGREKDKKPKYDFAEILRRSGTTQVETVKLGSLLPNPLLQAEEGKPESEPFTEKYAVLIQIGIGVILLGLGIWTVLLIRKGKRTKNTKHS